MNLYYVVQYIDNASVVRYQYFASNNGVTNGFLFLVSLACFHVVFHYTALRDRTPRYVTVLRDRLLSLACLPIVTPVNRRLRLRLAADLW